nr:hypothetical protein [Pseudomonadota bacterium]
MSRWMAEWRRRWAGLSDCGRVVVLVAAIAVLAWANCEARLVFRDKPSQAELAKILTLPDRGDSFVHIYFNQAFPKGSDIRDVLAFMDGYADEKNEFNTLDYPSISPNWAYWLSQITGEITHSLYRKNPAPSSLPRITWVVEIQHRRGRLVQARFMSHAPDENFLAWAKMQNWGETRQSIRHERDARIMEAQPTPKDIRLLADWLSIEDFKNSVGHFLYYSAEEEKYKESETAGYLHYGFYYKPHNTEIIPLNGDGIIFSFYFNGDKKFIKSSGSPTRHKLWANPADLVWFLLYRIVYC